MAEGDVHRERKHLHLSRPSCLNSDCEVSLGLDQNSSGSGTRGTKCIVSYISPMTFFFSSWELLLAKKG